MLTLQLCSESKKHALQRTVPKITVRGGLLKAIGCCSKSGLIYCTVYAHYCILLEAVCSTQSDCSNIGQMMMMILSGLIHEDMGGADTVNGPFDDAPIKNESSE